MCAAAEAGEAVRTPGPDCRFGLPATANLRTEIPLTDDALLAADGEPASTPGRSSSAARLPIVGLARADDRFQPSAAVLRTTALATKEGLTCASAAVEQFSLVLR